MRILYETLIWDVSVSDQTVQGFAESLQQSLKTQAVPYFGSSSGHLEQ